MWGIVNVTLCRSLKSNYNLEVHCGGGESREGPEVLERLFVEPNLD